MKKIKNKVLNKVHTICATLFVAVCITMLFAPEQTFAQTGVSKAKSALSTMTTDISGLYDTAWKALLAVAAIVAIIGGFIVYSKWSSGDPNATKLAAAWFGSALFLAIAGVFIKAMFL
jgi:hypothetical protein